MHSFSAQKSTAKNKSRKPAYIPPALTLAGTSRSLAVGRFSLKNPPKFAWDLVAEKQMWDLAHKFLSLITNCRFTRQFVTRLQIHVLVNKRAN